MKSNLVIPKASQNISLNWILLRKYVKQSGCWFYLLILFNMRNTVKLLNLGLPGGENQIFFNRADIFTIIFVLLG